MRSIVRVLGFRCSFLNRLSLVGLERLFSVDSAVISNIPDRLLLWWVVSFVFVLAINPNRKIRVLSYLVFCLHAAGIWSTIW